MMDRAFRRSILVCISLATATVLGVALKPHASTAASLPAIDLQQMVPATFADWRVEPVPSAGVAVDVQAEIDKVYSQVLDRTYVNAGGQRVMLSIAYGSDQETGTQLHRPEFCYEAQGFQVLTSQDGSLSTGFGKIPVRHMVAARGARIETVTYWITVGNRVTLPGIGRKFAQLSDGMVVRVSTLGEDAANSEAYRLQARFVQNLISAMTEPVRQRLTGGADL
jgi:EpsI family protein